MKKIVFILPVILMSLVVANCSGKDNSPTYVDRVTFDDLNEANNAVVNMDISCENESDCPESVGGLVYLDSKIEYPPYGLPHRVHIMGVCSQTLIAPDRVLTNRHCLPSSSFYKGASCSHITILFPKTSTKPYEKVGCKSVVDLSKEYSGDSGLKPDWAILELSSHVDRKFVGTNISGVAQDLALTSFPVYYEKLEIDTSSAEVKSVVKAKINKISCESKMNSLFAIYYNHPQSTILTLVCDHEVVKGNSGSGIFDKDGKLRGVINMAIENATKLTFMGEDVSVQNRVTGGTNTHCIGPFNDNQSTACNFDKNNVRARNVGYFLSMFYGQKATREEKNKYEEYLDSDDSIQWENHNVDMFSQIYSVDSLDNISSAVGREVAEFTVITDQKTRVPKTLKCISSSRINDRDFTVFWPIYEGRYKGMTVSDLSLVLIPLEAKVLEFKVNYDSSTSTFVGKLKRLGSDERAHFTNIREELEEKFVDCFTSDRREVCDSLYQIEQEIIEFSKSGNGTERLFTNENFIKDNSFGANDLIIPVCQ